MNEWAADKWEDMRVWWFMLDAQKKQALIVVSLNVFVAALALTTTLAKARITGGTR